jgi:hypothetical protein
MSKINFLILLSSFIFLNSCGLKLEETRSHTNEKYSISYLSGGENSFIFSNFLKQQLIANKLYNQSSLNKIKIELSSESSNQSSSITKVATRKLEKLKVNIRIYNEIKQTCIIFEKEYESDLTYLIADSSANLSNIAAENGIFLINSENISNKIVDDLLFFDNKC